MESRTRRSSFGAVAALALAAACGGGGGGGGGTSAQGDDPGAGWMDDAVVQVVMNGATGRETVTLVDEAGGRSAQVDDEAIDEGAVEFEDPQ